MVRPIQRLHAPRAPAAVHAAARLLLLRDGDQGLEVLMQHRAPAGSGTGSGAGIGGTYLFPGGLLQADDVEARPIATRRRTQSRHDLAHAVAAVRRAFEATGVLLAEHEDGSGVQASDVAGLERTSVPSQPLARQCVTHQLRLGTDRVWPLAHWITDRDHVERLDALYMVARMPEGQTPSASPGEPFEPCWLRPADALARHEAGEFTLAFATARTLRRLVGFDHVDGVLLACARERPLWRSRPRAGRLQGQDQLFMEQDAPYGELALVCPEGQAEHALDWQTETPVPLLRNVRRLTAPNAGMMTGPGTNSYIVGDAASGYVVIDPGPDDPGHVQRLWQATGGDIRAIVCTHSHADHAPGAFPLQALCQPAHPPILGLPSAPTARAAARFTPERALRNHERLVLESAPQGGDDESDGAAPLTHTLRVVHTPGHAANHLCLLLEEDGLLFSGDHILNGSTTVVDPPDGNMSEYLDSLDRLDAACQALGVEFILPAHGHVLGQARQAIARLKAHRLQREARIAAAMRQHPAGSLDDWLAQAYHDTPQKLWPVARRSLQAHVDRLRQSGIGDVQETMHDAGLETDF